MQRQWPDGSPRPGFGFCGTWVDTPEPSEPRDLVDPFGAALGLPPRTKAEQADLKRRVDEIMREAGY
jgi:hypothetical protein